MHAASIPQKAEDLLKHYRLPASSVFMVGLFDSGITVLSQQVRALNLGWALIESGEVGLDPAPVEGPRDHNQIRKRIAVVGAGFAGLTAAAGLLKKRVNADITIFERRDTVLPLQQGSDSRWLHPHIYDWPRPGSEAYSAALPVLNWTASRASDVVVQVLKEWAQVARAPDDSFEDGTHSKAPTVKVFCNTRHIQISSHVSERAMTVEWIGDERSSSEPAIPATGRPTPVGDSQHFDIVILAVGFGLESGARTSYWRNETLAQPHLGQARSTYIVSGAGNGGLIDLFRLRISHFRQDRILAELFSGHGELLKRLRRVHNESNGPSFDQLRAVWEDRSVRRSTVKVQERLRNRLRQDTMVLLRMRYPSFADVFIKERISFQNRLLVYLLYRCGAFTPVVAAAKDADLNRLAKEHGVSAERIIIRHGTETKAGLADVLAGLLDEKIEECFENKSFYRQTDSPRWPGGYFDMPGITEYEQGNIHRAKNEVRRYWRKEYLPSPTEAIATAFCSAIAGFLMSTTHRSARFSSRLRVTLHRTLISGDEVVLQQCCDYQGIEVRAEKNRAGRTFPSRNGTVGAAFDRRCVVRTKHDAVKDALLADMSDMSLNWASQNMASRVASVAAIPLLGPDRSLPGPARNVIGVLYLDSYDENAFVDDEMMGQVVSMCQSFLDSLPRVAETTAGRIANTEFWHRDTPRNARSRAIKSKPWRALEEARIGVPRSVELRHLNFDFSDFTPVEQE
ncbi:FAD-dependent oxidoreductase [Mycobacterium marseillense]|uniref:FAD-dependent oxidoreductase n=1 Tax=Mycobacterium marseillense TaxID=701042 RepID=UPI00259634C5|nr:FAD-dependent oxidoreductase [Mycobacterium marseillense]MDM3973868.1 FAD-dependent oxidoreductase [Mycobacterium marseillense]